MKRTKPQLTSLALPLLVSLSATQAGATDLANSPLITAAPNAIPANIFYVLDDSGSMAWDFLPDHIGSYWGGSSETSSSKQNACRTTSTLPSRTSSGSVGGNCCQGASTSSNSSACWTGSPPFGKAGHPPFLASSFNGMAYNPAVRYLPPVDASGNSYPSQTTWTAVRNDYYQVQNTATINLTTQFPDLAWCTDSTYTDCLRNGNYVLPGTVNGKNYTTAWITTASGTGFIATGNPDAPVASSSAAPLGPHYYVITPGEYCTTSALRNCQATQNATYNVPAYVRWCGSAADATAAAPATGNCQATRTTSFPYARYPTRFFTAGTPGTAAQPATPASVSFTITMGNGCGTVTTGSGKNKVTTTYSASASRLTVGGTDLFGGIATASETRASNLASDIAAQINAKTGTNGGYTASASSSTVTITAPVSAGNLTSTASLTRVSSDASATCTFTPTTTSAFSGYAAATAAVAGTPGTFPGGFTRVDIVSGNTYAKAATRTDCAGTSCTYTEEMTNFANWWAYYHTRMQATKSGILRAFASVGGNRRLGYMSIDNNTGSDFLNLASFQNSTSPASTQRTDWFNKITSARPNSGTPLRVSLAKAGQMYAGKLTSINSGTVNDPMQYACQRNYTILSTDGFWNDSSNPKQLNGTTDIGDQDGSLARPMLDGSGTANTLSDVAAYYYNTDLRTPTANNCQSGNSGAGNRDVCGTGQTYEKQNMVTFTLGLGISGYMKFDPNYATQTSGDYFAVKNGSAANLSADICSWQSSGACNWPVPIADTLTAVDDLWHAAVNGGGSYFSASDPSTFANGLISALNKIDAYEGAGAAAATSNPNVTTSDNSIYLTGFTSGDWTGEVTSRSIDVTTGNLSSAAAAWTAAGQLDGNTNRTIYMFSASASNKLKAFSWSSMNATEQGYFSLAALNTGSNALSQFCTSNDPTCLSSAAQTAAAGENLVNYLAGDRSNEGSITDMSKYFRARVHLLGDTVNAESVFVGTASGYNYQDAGYAAFKGSAGIANRQRMLYVGANDGMLHAFNADTGAEVWAFVPTAVLPNLPQLADKQYANKHRYFVDATPIVQDVFIGGHWRTILVGGLGGGGRAYYALDITDPGNPSALWEYTDSNLGYTYGTPEIGKLADGTWAVFFGSGYNNVSPGDGVGRLYVLNAADGTLVRTISTGTGSTSTPSGLAQVRAWLANGNLDNSVLRVYAGDTLGNVWRFDVNDDVGAPGYDAQLLASLRTAAGMGGVVQPITTRPELYSVNGVAIVYIGTGRFLGQSDYNNTDTQSIYAIKDDLSAAANHGNPRDASAHFVVQTLVDSTCPSGSAFCTAGSLVRNNGDPQPVDWTVNGGWYVDLPRSAERVNTDPQIVLGTLVVTSNVLTNSDPCQVGGFSFVNYFDAATGHAVSNANGLVSVYLGDALSTRATAYSLPNGDVVGGFQLANRKFVTKKVPLNSTVQNTRRLSWRDLNTN
ncbi:pilus assembly protein [Roseateles sp.]|uniref:pilus assembly protein n=1 Tax=Roseateles sp. TaxID=1971397 RepID=UPI0039EA64C7